MPVHIHEPIEPLWDFDPDDELLTCDISGACRFRHRSRAAMYDHYRESHANPRYPLAQLEVPGVMQVGESGWDSDKVWQSLDFYFKGYDETWWETADIKNTVNCAVHFFGEPAWYSVRRKLIAQENAIKECA